MEKQVIQELMDEIAPLKIVVKEIQNNDYKMQIFFISSTKCKPF